MRTTKRFFMAAFLICGIVCNATAQLTFTSGADPLAGPNGDEAAGLFWNFSNSGSGGEFASGPANNIYSTDPQTWSQQTVYNISFSYAPTRGEAFGDISGIGVGAIVPTPSMTPTELQILIGNTGPGNVTLTLTSINSVAFGGILNGGGPPYVYGGTQNLAAGTTWSAANGNILQAYLNDPTIFGAAFTIHGTITLDSPANSANYGDGLNSFIQMSLAPTPEPSTGLLFGVGLGFMALVRKRRTS